MRLPACLLTAFIAATQGLCLAAAPPDAAEHPQVRGALALLDRWVEAHQIYEQVPGISMGIVLGQDLVWSTAYGRRNVGRARPAEVDTLYSICSISKLFTSMALMQQRDAGRLQLDDEVVEHLDWFDIEQAHPDSGPITLRGLLTHSSGLPRESVNAYWNPDYPFPSRQEVVEGMAGQQTLYPSGAYFQYSNLAMTLVGEIAAAAAGEPYAVLVQERLLGPLGLKDTRPHLPGDLHGARLAVGYSARNRHGERSAEPLFDTAGITPAAGFTSNVPDLAAFAAWQFRLLKDGGEEVMKASTLREMQRVHWVDPDWKTTWGLGFAVRKVEENTLVSHGGSCPGYTTAFTLMPEHELAVIVLMNANGVDPFLVASNAYKLLGPALKKAGEPAAQDADAGPPDLSDYEGLYHNRPWSSEVAFVQRGDELLVADLPSRDVTADLTRLQREDGDTFRRVREDDDTLGERWTFTRNDAGDISGVGFHGVRLRRAR